MDFSHTFNSVMDSLAQSENANLAKLSLQKMISRSVFRQFGKLCFGQN